MGIWCFCPDSSTTTCRFSIRDGYNHPATYYDFPHREYAEVPDNEYYLVGPHGQRYPLMEVSPPMAADEAIEPITAWSRVGQDELAAF